MSMHKYESDIKHIPYSVETVHNVLSDLTNLNKLTALLDNADTLAKIEEQVGSDNAAKARATLDSMKTTTDSAMFTAPMVGNVTLKIVEREEPKLVKYETKGLPVSSCLWIQTIPDGKGCKMKITAGADVNFLFKSMADKYLSPGVNRMADILASLPYDQI